MSAFALYLRELYYRALYGCLALLLACGTAWMYRYTYLQVYLGPVTHTVYVLDVGEDVRMGVYMSVYLGVVWSMGYMYYVYLCYTAPARYGYEHRGALWRGCVLWMYITGVYLWGMWYIWPQVYGMFLGTPMGVYDIWGVSVNTMPRVGSLVVWSLWVPCLCVCMLCMPVYGVFHGHGPWMSRYRRTWYVCGVLCAGALCPPYPWVQLVVSLIFWLFYEFTCLCVCIRQCVSKTSTT